LFRSSVDDDVEVLQGAPDARELADCFAVPLRV
jgi:hypothetical protein